MHNTLELTVRAARVARTVGATTAGDLARLTADELLSARCFGMTLLEEIEKRLAERGLRLGMSAAELRWRIEAGDLIVVRGETPDTPPEAEHAGACCGHCEEASRQIRERAKPPRRDRRTEPKPTESDAAPLASGSG